MTERRPDRHLAARGAAAVAPELPPVAHAPTRSDSFDALFAAPSALVSPVPFSFHLLELVRPLLFPDPAVSFAKYDLRYDNGLAVTVELHGHGELGLPTVYDYDPLFALVRLAAEREVNELGELRGVSFRDVARTMGVADEHYGGRVHTLLKESLNRWAALKFATNFDFTPPRRGAEARDGRVRPSLPDALPRRVRPKKQWYFVMQHGVHDAGPAGTGDVDALAGDGGAREILGTVRFDPVWLDAVASGATAWVDLELHAGLAERYAKRLYEVLLVRALRRPTWSAHEPWVVTVAELLAELGVRDLRKRSRDTVIAKLPLLGELGVLGAWREQRGRGDQHLLELEPGERLTAARAYAGVRMHERPELARLIWGLQQAPWSFSLPEARHLAETRPAVTLRVLQRAVYLLETGWEPSRSWSGWLKDALVEEYAFAGDARYQSWLDVRLRGYRAPAFIDVRQMPRAVADRLRTDAGLGPARLGGELAGNDGTPATGESAVHTAPSAPPEQFEDTAWGRVRQRLAAELPPATYAAWVRPLAVRRLPAPGAPECELAAVDAFAAEWVTRKYATRIAELASAELGAPVPVSIVDGAHHAHHALQAG